MRPFLRAVVLVRVFLVGARLAARVPFSFVRSVRHFRVNVGDTVQVTCMIRFGDGRPKRAPQASPEPVLGWTRLLGEVGA